MQEAIKWWTNLNLEDKFYQVIPWLKENNRNVTERHPHDLKDYEILELYKKTLC